MLKKSTKTTGKPLSALRDNTFKPYVTLRRRSHPLSACCQQQKTSCTHTHHSHKTPSTMAEIKVTVDNKVTINITVNHSHHDRNTPQSSTKETSINIAVDDFVRDAKNAVAAGQQSTIKRFFSAIDNSTKPSKKRRHARVLLGSPTPSKIKHSTKQVPHGGSDRKQYSLTHRSTAITPKTQHDTNHSPPPSNEDDQIRGLLRIESDSNTDTEWF